MTLNKFRHSKTTDLFHPISWPGAVRITWTTSTYMVIYDPVIAINTSGAALNIVTNVRYTVQGPCPPTLGRTYPHHMTNIQEL